MMKNSRFEYIPLSGVTFMKNAFFLNILFREMIYINTLNSFCKRTRHGSILEHRHQRQEHLSSLLRRRTQVSQVCLFTEYCTLLKGLSCKTERYVCCCMLASFLTHTYCFPSSYPYFEFSRSPKNRLPCLLPRSRSTSASLLHDPCSFAATRGKIIAIQSR